MKRLFQIIILLLIASGSISAQSPKREVRSVWLTTTWGQSMDWPSVTVPAATGNNEDAREYARNTQKSGLIAILDRLQAINFNTVYFQVRGMCDAFYKSQYEPWSQWLSSTRGADPGWDPLEFVIEEAHKRGMELHAWLNPYRYSTADSSHGNLDSDYFKTHPDWLLDYGNYVKILNPGMPEVKQRICDVIEDIVTRYDVDGIIFDDYFYQNGTGSLDAATQTLYKPSGMDVGNWRRRNVNEMIAAVYNTIKGIKPHVTFGVSPAGVAKGGAADAGVSQPPISGSDWQYNQIYADPIAWVKENSIDYISPQIYWTIASSTNSYSALAKWWSEIANKFNRNFYASSTSHSGGSSTSTRFSTSEILAQLRWLRNTDLNGTPGTVLFRYKTYLSTTYDAFEEDMCRLPALTALYGWKPAATQGLVENLAVSGQNLTWTYADSNVRYAVYAIPNANRGDADVFTSPKYLQGVSYTTGFTLSNKISTATHKIAVAVYDRHGNLFPPRVLGEATTTLNPAQLIYPANNQADMDLPVLFSWNDSDADYYVWQLAEDAGFTKPLASRETGDTNFNSALQACIKANTTYYWRVKSIKANAPVAVSEVRAFNGARAGQSVKINSPSNGATVSSLTPTITWTAVTGATYTLDISTQLSFDDIVYSTTGTTASAAVPSGLLKLSTTYYIRVRAELATRKLVSDPVYFTTTFVPPATITVPVIISPVDGETISGTDIEVTWQEQRSRGFKIELSQSSAFPPRDTKPKTTTALVYRDVYEKLNAGTYYIRMKALMDDEKETDPTKAIIVYLTGPSAIPDVDAAKSCYNYYDAAGNCYIVINNVESSAATVDTYSITGVLLNKQIYPLNAGKNTVPLDMTDYAKGFYLIKVNAGSIEKTMKVRK